MQRSKLRLILFITGSIFFAAHTYAGPSAVEMKEFSAGDLKSVRIKNQEGHLKVVAVQGSGTTATVTVNKVKFQKKCKLTIEKVDSEINVSVDDKGFIKSHDCQADIEVSIPKKANLKLVNGAGDVQVEGIEGILEFVVGAGDVNAKGEFKGLDGKSGSGGIQIEGLAGGGELKTGSGDITLKFHQNVVKGNLDIKTGSGNAKLLFSKGARVKTDFVAGSGSLTNELGDSFNSDFKVSMKAGSGNLEVKSY